MSGLKIEHAVTIAGRWPLDRPGHRFTLGQMEKIVRECRAAGLQSDVCLTFSGGGSTLGGDESAAFELPAETTTVRPDGLPTEIMKGS